MPNIYADSTDGYIRYFGIGTAWTVVRDGSSGAVTASGSNMTAAPYSGSLTFFGSTSSTVTRVFLKFDTSGISSAPSSATLKIYGHGTGFGGRADVWALKSNAFTDSGSLQGSDFDNIVGWSTGSSDGSGGGDNESNVTKYSDMYDVSADGWTITDYNDIALNSTALSDMASLDEVQLCIITHRDLKDLHSGAGDITYNGLYFQNNTGTDKDPYIDYTAAVAATDNSVFFGSNF